MFVITGITGKVGGNAAEALLAKGFPVRAVVRDETKAAPWRDRGCEVAIVPDVADEDALADAFDGAVGVFLMSPPNYDPEPGFPDLQRSVHATSQAIQRSRPGKIVFLSTVGAQATEYNLLHRSSIVEKMLTTCGVPVCLLRAAWFMENAAWDVAAARDGQILSHLQPVTRPIEMVSTRDIGKTAADLLLEDWEGVRIVELSGPRKYSPADIAKGFATILGHPVEVVAVPRERWETQFRAEGMLFPEARMRMLDGFNEGWIDFQKVGTEHRTGTVELESVLSDLLRVNREG